LLPELPNFTHSVEAIPQRCFPNSPTLSLIRLFQFYPLRQQFRTKQGDKSTSPLTRTPAEALWNGL